MGMQACVRCMHADGGELRDCCIQLSFDGEARLQGHRDTTVVTTNISRLSSDIYLTYLVVACSFAHSCRSLQRALAN